MKYFPFGHISRGRQRFSYQIPISKLKASNKSQILIFSVGTPLEQCPKRREVDLLFSILAIACPTQAGVLLRRSLFEMICLDFGICCLRFFLSSSITCPVCPMKSFHLLFYRGEMCFFLNIKTRHAGFPIAYIILPGISRVNCIFQEHN